MKKIILIINVFLVGIISYILLNSILTSDIIYPFKVPIYKELFIKIINSV